MSTAKILFVDDNEDMRQTIKTGLERDGYDVTAVGDGKTLLEQLRRMAPDVILLDIGLPDHDGLQLMGDIRTFTDAPVIVVSGKNDPIDKVVGLEMGADDYVGKPFQMRELSARVKAQLRRTQGKVSPAPNPPLKQADKIVFGAWVFDRARLQVFDGAGASAGLTVKEFRLLEAFLLSPNRVLSREQLLEMSRSHGFNVTDRAIDTQIARLRKKLDGENENSLIEAVRGAGYILKIEPKAIGRADS